MYIYIRIYVYISVSRYFLRNQIIIFLENFEEIKEKKKNFQIKEINVKYNL